MIGQRTTIGGGKKIMIVKGDAALIAEHAVWVEAYQNTILLAASGYPHPLTASQKEAYLLLPDLIEQCHKAYFLIPPALRPVHYLCV